MNGKNSRRVGGKRYEMVVELETACNGREMIGKRPEMGRIVKCYEYPGMPFTAVTRGLFDAWSTDQEFAM